MFFSSIFYITTAMQSYTEYSNFHNHKDFIVYTRLFQHPDGTCTVEHLAMLAVCIYI